MFRASFAHLQEALHKRHFVYCVRFMSAGGNWIGIERLQHCHVTSQARIIAAVKNIDAPMLTRVWQEFEHRIDTCRVTRGAHIEHL
jgi:hypothetical protein